MTKSLDGQRGRLTRSAITFGLILLCAAGCGDADIRRGDDAMARQEFPIAVEAYEAALARDAADVQARYRLVEALVSQINVGRAQGRMPLPELAAAIDRVHEVILPIRNDEPDLLAALVNLHVSLARTYDDANMPERARETWRRVAEVQPSADVHFNVGQASMELADWQEAVAAFNDALEFDPSHAEALKGLGNVYIQLSQDEDAVQAYSQVLEIRPNDTRTRYNLGVALARVGRYDDAMTEYAQVVEEDPDYPLAYRGMRNAMERKGDADGAAEWDQKWREKAGLAPDEVDPLGQSGSSRTGMAKQAAPVSAPSEPASMDEAASAGATDSNDSEDPVAAEAAPAETNETQPAPEAAPAETASE